jgi:hypothetical protein
MTVQHARNDVQIPTIPAPRRPPAEDVTSGTAAPVGRPVPTGGKLPWPEPWRHSRAERPRSEFWDVRTASWHSAGPYPRTGQD